MLCRREEIIELWFKMWLQKDDLGIDSIFTPDCKYIESWGPCYQGISQVKHWFDEWNTRGRVIVWDIKQYLHSEDQTMVEWYFQYAMLDGQQEGFDGISLIEWRGDKINLLKEFACKLPNYNYMSN